MNARAARRYAGQMTTQGRDWMTLTFSGREAVPPLLAGVRGLREGDAMALGRLMWDSYRGTIDDAGETLEDAQAEAIKTLTGGYGVVDHEATCLVEYGTPSQPQLVAATIIVRDATRWFTGEAFVAFSLTAPAYQRQGLARAGLARAIGVLARRGESRLHLVVTRANTPAVALYESIGFTRAQLKPTGSDSERKGT